MQSLTCTIENQAIGFHQTFKLPLSGFKYRVPRIIPNTFYCMENDFSGKGRRDMISKYKQCLHVDINPDILPSEIVQVLNTAQKF
jgi:hypothetical protein